MEAPMMQTSVDVIVVSDSVAAGTAKDTSGAAVVALLRAHAHFKDAYVELSVVSDDEWRVCEAIANRVESIPAPSLVLTVGGTGFAPRDRTPEATRTLLTRHAPGLSTAMTLASLQKTPYAALSRGVCGIVERHGTSAIVVNLPGSRKGAVENLEAIVDTLPHALDSLRGIVKRSAHANRPAPASSSSSSSSSSIPAASPSAWGAPGHARAHSHSHSHGHSHSHSHSHGDATSVAQTPPGRGRGRARQSRYAMVSVSDALATIRAQVTPERRAVSIDVYALYTSGPRVLAERDGVVAHENVPRVPTSAKDGYAVVAADGAGEFDVIDAVATGTTAAAAPTVRSGTLAEIATGAALPPGADAVVMIERTEVVAYVDGGDDVGDRDSGAHARERVVRVLEGVAAGADVRPVGCDLAAGTRLLAHGAVLRAPQIGLLLSALPVAQHTAAASSPDSDTAKDAIAPVAAGAARPTVQVYRVPTVGVLSSGDELLALDAGAPFATSSSASAIFDSNRGALIAALHEQGLCGDSVRDLGIVRDELALVTERLRAAVASGVDVILTTGAVSMGRGDYIKPALEALGTVYFGRVRTKPGKPMTFATIKRDEAAVQAGTHTDGGSLGKKVFVFALPGNPVSALVTFYQFVCPALSALVGAPEAAAPLIAATLLDEVWCDPERPEYHRGVLEWDAAANGYTVASTGAQQSSRLLSMSEANCVLHLPMERRKLAVGEIVQVSRIPPSVF